MRKLIIAALFALTLAGCATTGQYGNFVPAAAGQQQIATDAVQQLAPLYPPAPVPVLYNGTPGGRAPEPREDARYGHRSEDWAPRNVLAPAPAPRSYPAPGALPPMPALPPLPPAPPVPPEKDGVPVAFVVTVPVNRWLIGRGRGHAVAAAYLH